MENLKQSLLNLDSTRSKLRCKLSYYGLREGIHEYQEECVDLILNNSFIYMKSIIRQMVKEKRSYQITCPLLTLKKEKQESEEKNRLSINETGSKLKPWHMPFNIKAVNSEFFEMLEKNDKKEAKEKALLKRQFLKQVKNMKSKPPLLKTTDINFIVGLNSEKAKDFKKDNKSKNEVNEDSGLKVIEILKNCSEKPQKNDGKTADNEETNISLDEKSPQHNKQKSSNSEMKESGKQDGYMDIVDVSEDELSTPRINDRFKNQTKKSKSSPLKRLGVKLDKNKSLSDNKKRIIIQALEKYHLEKYNEVESACKKCERVMEDKECRLCKKPVKVTDDTDSEKVTWKKDCAKVESQKQKSKRDNFKTELQRSEKDKNEERSYGVESLFSEIRYSSEVFSVLDLYQLLKRYPLLIPKRNFYQVTMNRISSRFSFEPPQKIEAIQ